MKRSVKILLGALFGVIVPFALAAAQDTGAAAVDGGATGLVSAITKGKVGIAGRYRYEHVDQDNALSNANASTLRLRLNYRTGQWQGWSAFGEFDHVFHVLIDDFNSGAGTSPNRTDYSVVADPSGSDLNQLYVDYGSSDDWQYRFGRQRILLDNQRFVGGVGWRQNEQTYDALTVNTGVVERTAFSYSYVNRVRRIFGQTVPAGKARVDGHLLNAKVDVTDRFAVTPYLYHLDYATDVANSTSTLGVRLTGNLKAGDGRITYLAEFARQSDAGDNPVSYDADYLHLNGMWALENGLSVGLAFESLGGSSDPGEFFRTPLATLHAFNGWADQFLTTPDGGLDDFYATVKLKVGAWNVTGVYHDFSSETGSDDYGQELDISAGRKLGERYGILFKGALFSADSSSPLTNVDTNKFWIMLTASY